MSAKKLGRLAGLVFVLAAILGGVGSAALGAKHAGASGAIQVIEQSIEWG